MWPWGYVQRVGEWTLGTDHLGLQPGSATPTWALSSIKWTNGCRKTGVSGAHPAYDAVLTYELWKFISTEHRIWNHHGKSTSRPGGTCGPLQVLTRDWDCQAVLLLRPLHCCERLSKSLPIKQESPQTERAERSTWGHFLPFCIPHSPSPGLSSAGLEEPRKRNCVGHSLTQHQRPLGLSFLWRPHFHLLPQ